MNKHNPVCSVVIEEQDKMKYIFLKVFLQTDTMEICVCDWMAHRIQVFSREGVLQRTINPQGLSFPSVITVRCRGPYRNCNELSGSIMFSVKTENTIYSFYQLT